MLSQNENQEKLGKILKEIENSTTLDITHTFLGDAGAKEVAEVLKFNKSWKFVSLYNNYIGDAGAKEIAEALKVNKSMTSLDLSDNSIGDAGTKEIAEALKVNESLKVLDLYNNNIGDGGAKEIAEMLKANQSLSILNLYNSSHEFHPFSNKIGNSGAKAIAEAIKINKSLTILNLKENKIGEDGAKEIAEGLKVNKSLKTVNLFLNNLSAVGIKHIAEALQFNNSLTNIGIFDADCHDLLEANHFYSQALFMISEKKFSAEILRLLKKAYERKPFDKEISSLAKLSLSEISDIYGSQQESEITKKNHLPEIPKTKPEKITLESPLSDKPKPEFVPEDDLRRDFFRYLELKCIPFIEFSGLKISSQEILGTGKFSKVYKGFFIKSPVAIKEYLNINIFDGNQNEKVGLSYFSIITELDFAISFDFPKFNRFYGVSLNDQGYLFSVHELAESSLAKKLKEGALNKIQQKHDIAEQILQIMLMLQKREVIHCNLKPTKFLFKFEGDVEIYDLGSIRLIRNDISEETLSFNKNCTVKYAPPEFIFLQDGEFGELGMYSDIWSLGIILFEIYYNKPFWGKMTNDNVIVKIKGNDVPQAKESQDVPMEITTIVNRALVRDGEERITLREVFELFEKGKAKKN